MNFYHTLPVQIRFNDLDPAGHINNSVYMEYFDIGKINYYREAMGNSMNFGNSSLVIASFRVDFYKPVFMDDPIEVKSKITSLGNKSLEMIQQICKTGETEPAAVSTTVLVCFDYTAQISKTIPQEWRDRIRYFEHFECSDRQESGMGSDIQ